MEQNPMMWIMQADPGKYIKTTSSAIAAFLKLIEGFFTAFAAVGLFGLFKEFVRGGSFQDGLSVELLPRFFVDHVLNMIPQDLLAQSGVSGQAGAAAQLDLSVLNQLISFLTIDVYTGALIEQITLFIAVWGVILILLGIAVEGLFSVILRFSMQGANVLKLIQRVIVYSIIAILASAVGFFVYRIYLCFSTGQFKLAVVLLPAGSVIVFLVLALKYARSVFSVFFSIDYEIRLGFKDSDARFTKMRGYSLMFGFIFLVATIAIVVLAMNQRIGYGSAVLCGIGCGFMSLKYFVVSRAAWNFLWCHQ
jgi:hypothetical protein